MENKLLDNKNIQKNIKVTLILKPIGMILSLIYIPLVLKYLGSEKYGVWATILSIISWINYFDIGIGNGLKNKLSEYLTNNDKKKAGIAVSTAALLTAIISVIFFVLFFILDYFIDYATLFNLNILGENTRFVVLFSVGCICVNFVLSLGKTMMYSFQKPGINAIISIFVQISNLIAICLISKITNGSLFLVAIMYCSTSLISNIILDIWIIRRYNYLKPKIANVKKEGARELVTLGIMFFAMQICSLVLTTTDNLLISKVFGSSAVTPYNIVYKAFNIIITVHNAIILPLWAAYTSAYATKNYRWIKESLNKVLRISLLLVIGALILALIFKPLAHLWLGTKLEYGHLIFMMAFYIILQMLYNSYSCVLCGVGYVKVASITSVIGAVLNIPLSIFFAKQCGMGVEGILLGSIVVMALYVIVTPITYYYWMNKYSVQQD